MDRSFINRSTYKNILGNVLLFLPFGFFVAYFVKVDKPFVMILLSLLVSLSIETTQLAIGRVFDVDDVILNVLGGFLGFTLYKFFIKIFPERFKRTWVLNIIIILLIIIIVRFLVPWKNLIFIMKQLTI